MKAVVFAIFFGLSLAPLPLGAQALSLTDVVSAALAHNPAIRATDLEIDAREHERLGIRGRFGPVLKTSASALVWDDANRTRMDLSAITQVLGELVSQAPPESQQRIAAMQGATPGITLHDQMTYRVSTTVAQPLLGLIGISHAHEAAQQTREAAASDAQDARRALQLDVVKGFYALVSARGMEASVRAAIAQIEGVEQQVRALLDAGRLESNALLKVQVQRADLERALLAAQKGARGATALLNLWMGRPLDSPLELAGARDVDPADLLAAPDLELSELHERALADRPDVRALRHRAAAAEAYGEAAWSAMLPELHAVFTYEFQEGMGDMQPQNQAFGGLVLNWNLWEWGASYHQVKAARTRSLQARAKLDVLHERIALEVRQRQDDLDEAAAALRVAERQVTHARENLRVEDERFRHGQTTTTDLLQAQSFAVSAESHLVAERANLERSYHALLLATGDDLLQDRARRQVR